MDAVRIDEGHFGNTRLDGLCFINTFAWPGAVHEGDGTFQAMIDERADAAQRRALIEISHGRETPEGANAFSVYATTYSTILDPLFVPIEFECDLEKRDARVRVPGVLDSRGEPIRNQVTGDEQRVRVVMPKGFEYTEAEYGSGTTRATAGVALEFNESYAQLHVLHWNQAGVVR